jgi:hypothetical protein
MIYHLYVVYDLACSPLLVVTVGIKPEARTPNPNYPDPTPNYPKPEKSGVKSGGIFENPNYFREIWVYVWGTRTARFTRSWAKSQPNLSLPHCSYGPAAHFCTSRP